MGKLLNKSIHKIPEDSVYIGRPSKWGNPFVIGKDGTRDEVVEKYEKYLLNSSANSSLINNIKELRGKTLVCWCYPLRCHGEILLKHANPSLLEF